jgi:hypothetical protein
MIEVGEQFFTFTDALMCPVGSGDIAATPVADSVPSDPTVPMAKMGEAV